MKVKQEKSDFKPIIIVLETKDEFAKLLCELGELSLDTSPIFSKIYDKLDDIRVENRW